MNLKIEPNDIRQIAQMPTEELQKKLKEFISTVDNRKLAAMLSNLDIDELKGSVKQMSNSDLNKVIGKLRFVDKSLIEQAQRILKK